MEKRLILLVLTIAASMTQLYAQSESGLILGVAVDKKINKQVSVGLEADYRSRNDFKTAERWSLGVGAGYKLTKWLKADAGYSFLNTNYREKISGESPKRKWRPSYWGGRHRLHLSLSADHKLWGNLRVSLRERWQYTYRPEQAVDRWIIQELDFGDATWKTKKLDSDYVREGVGKHQLRSRLQVEWDKKHAMLTPFANVEFYNSLSVEKVRYTVGTDIKLGKQHSLNVYYRFQDIIDEDEDSDPDMHYLGLGYKFKF